MILLSRLIKAPDTPGSFQQTRSIQVKPVLSRQAQESKSSEGENRDEAPGHSEIKQEQERLRRQREDIEASRKQAEEELQQARKRISEEEENSKQRLEQAFADAKKAGWKEGYEEGKEEGRTAWEQAVEEARDVISSAKEEYHYYLEKAEPVILDLALAAANRIIYKSLEDEDGTWLEIVKNAVKEVKDHEEVAVYVPASRLEETKQQRQEMENLLAYSQELMIFPDSSLNENDCIIETPYGKVDASLDSQLQELKEQLEEKLKEGGLHESS